MAQISLQFGDETTADVKLRLILPNGTEYDANPLHLHSQVLTKYEYFEAFFSERWSSGMNSIEFKINSRQNVNDYDCVDACMAYLEGVRWTPLEHVQIRDSLSALQINPQPDLAARLCTSKGEYLKIMEEVLSKMLSLISNGAPQCTWDITQKIIAANIAANSSDALVDMTFAAILQETQSNIDIIASQLRRIQLFDSKSSQKMCVAKSSVGWFLVQCTGRKSGIQRSVKMFAHQLDLAQAILGRAQAYNPFTETLLDILDGTANVMGNGDVICPRSVRLSFITTWLPVIRKLGEDDGKNAKVHANLVEGLTALIETLPLVDQKQIFQLWMHGCLKSSSAHPDLGSAFESRYAKLRKAHCESQG
eukprot:Gb_33963 [translate_table: standard]